MMLICWTLTMGDQPDPRRKIGFQTLKLVSRLRSATSQGTVASAIETAPRPINEQFGCEMMLASSSAVVASLGSLTDAQQRRLERIRAAARLRLAATPSGYGPRARALASTTRWHLRSVLRRQVRLCPAG